MLVRAEFQSQAIDDPLSDLVLHSDDIGRRRIDTIAPQNLAAGHVQKLRGDAETLAHMYEPGGQDGINVQLAADVARVGRLPLVLRHYRRRPHDQRADAREFGNHRVGQSEFVKARLRIVIQILERQNGQALLRAISNGDKRRFGRSRGRN